MKTPSGPAAALLLLIALAAPAAAQDKSPTREEARAITLKAAELIAAKGLEEAAKLFNMDGEFKYGEIYVNVIDFTGVWRVYPLRPSAVGQSVLDIRDLDGKALVREIIAIARDKGEGWTEYRWLNPATNRVAPKVTFVKRVPGQELIAYSGVYK